MHSAQALGEARKARERRAARGCADPAARVDRGADAQRFAPRVEPEDLVALDATHFEAEAVRSHVDDRERRGGRLRAVAAHGARTIAEAARAAGEGSR